MSALAEKDKLVDRKNVVTLEQKHKDLLLKSLQSISGQVINKLLKDNVPGTPENYKIYFEAQLENKPRGQKKDISALLALESKSDNEHVQKLEQDIHNAFLYIKSMTESIALAYAKLVKIKDITDHKKKELEKNPTHLALVSYKEDLSKISYILQNELKSIKGKYSDTAELLKNFNDSSIYDKKFHLYNKKFLLRTINSELDSMRNFHHESTLLAIQLKKDCLKNISSNKDKTLILLNLSKMLLKRARRSDIIAHYENGIFMIVMKHTDKASTYKAMERIEDMIGASSFIVNSNSIDIEVTFALSSINTDKTSEEIIVEALNGLST